MVKLSNEILVIAEKHGEKERLQTKDIIQVSIDSNPRGFRGGQTYPHLYR